jgi:DNA-binding transcriptional regulator GbsR (MarR family)
VNAERRRSRGRDQSAVRRFVERFAGALVDAGMPRMPALVFAALLSADGARLSAAELVDQLQISRAAVSGAVRYLNGLGIVRREREPGSRRDHYVFENDSWYEMIARREHILDQWVATTKAGVEAVGPATDAGRRLSESLAFFEFLQTEMPALLARWRARQTGKRA